MMDSNDVQNLRGLLENDIIQKLTSFKNHFVQCTHAMNLYCMIIRWISKGKINFERFRDHNFGYSEETWEKLCAKVRELVLMMRFVDTKEYAPLSMGSIKNVGLSLIRRIFYVANEKEILEHAGETVYPYIIVHDLLKKLMFQVFLHIYFSDLCDELIPFFVWATISLCKRKSVVRFNVRYPVRNIRVKELDQNHLFSRVLKMRSMSLESSEDSQPVKEDEKDNEKEKDETKVKESSDGDSVVDHEE